MSSRMEGIPFLLIMLVFLLNGMSMADNDPVPNPYFAMEAKSKPCSFFDTINITDGIRNFEDDSITHNGIVYNSEHHKTYDYIITVSFEKEAVARHIRGCVCHYRVCFRLCCDPGTILVNRTCQPTEEFPEFNVNIEEKGGTKYTLANLYNNQIYSYTVGKPCESWFSTPDETYTLSYNGSLLYQNAVYDSNSYCLAYWSEDEEDYPNRTLRIEVNACTYEPKKVSAVFNNIAMLISVPCLLMTFLVYVWLRELRETLPGKSLMCYVLVLAIAYGSLGIVQINGANHIKRSICTAVGYVIQGSFTASFLWLNVISFDIWWTFGKGKDHSGRRFRKYSLYAWGVTCILLLACFMMDTIPNIPDSLRPKIGEKQCWLYRDQLIEFLYLYFPILIIVIVNSTFFGMTAHKICYAQKATAAALKQGDSQKHAKVQSDQEKFGLYFRLFIIMGVTWSMEFIAWALDRNQEIIFFFITDLCNAIQGILIFILFVCKTRVKKLIEKRYRQLRGLPEPSTITQTNTSTTQMLLNQVEKN